MSHQRNKNDSAAVLSNMKKETQYHALVKTYQADLYRYAYWLTGAADVADDLVQETFLRAWKALDSLQDQGAVKSWLITILRRENARRFERKQFDLVDIDEVSHHNMATSDDHEEDQIVVLRRLIGELPTEYREPLSMQILFGFSGEEIGNVLGLNLNTVMTRLFRARKQLKDLVSAQQQGDYNYG